MAMTEKTAREILKKHAAANGDSQYEPVAWVVAAMEEAAELASKAADKAWLTQIAYEDSADVVARRMGYPNAT